MGTGIALVGAAKAKVNVVVTDVSQKQLDSCLKFADSLVRLLQQAHLLMSVAFVDSLAVLM